MYILLASSSPRRQALLVQLGLPFRVYVPQIDEREILARLIRPDAPHSIEMARVSACAVAQAKADAALAASHAVGAVVVAADTMVVCDGQVLNKPIDNVDVKRMLRDLSGRAHHVITGLCVHDGTVPAMSQGADQRCEAAVTEVIFRQLNDALIDAYVDSGEPLDKAGGYGIQGLGAALVERVDGCYFNVVGLPLALLCRLLEELGHPVHAFWSPRK